VGVHGRTVSKKAFCNRGMVTKCVAFHTAYACSIFRFFDAGTGSMTGAPLFGMLIYRVTVCLNPTAPEPNSRSLGEYADENGEIMPLALNGEVTIGEVIDGDAIRGE
jgi:hypothetical protein